MRWRIYYADGSTFSSEDGGPEEAPTRGVIVIASEAANERGFTLQHGGPHAKDYYLWREDADGWCLADMGGLWDYLLSRNGWKVVLSGETIRTEEYLRIVGVASSEGVG